MSKVEDYRNALRNLEDWEPFLLLESGLPGPRGNLELVQAVADEGDESLFRRYAALGPELAPTHTSREFLTVCGVVGLGRLLAEGTFGRRAAAGRTPSAGSSRRRGQSEILADLHHLASDPRWRVREGVAMALQRWGDRDMDALLLAMRSWAEGPPLVQRAAAAGLCEPRLLGQERHAAEVLDILHVITTSLSQASDRRSADLRTLRQALGYCWSVAAVALPDQGKKLLEQWLAVPDPDVRWIMKENLKKNRLLRLDPDWVRRSLLAATGEERQQRQAQR